MSGAPIGTSYQRAFIEQHMPLARRVAERIGVSPHMLLGQWGLETGWGRSVVPGTNNLGNIKDFSGDGVAAKDNYLKTRDKYRKYDTPDDFGEHYAELMETRYRDATGAGDDATKFFTALRKAGYAQKPTYVQEGVSTSRRVSDIARSMGLDQPPPPPPAPAPPPAMEQKPAPAQSFLDAAADRLKSAGRGLMHFIQD